MARPAKLQPGDLLQRKNDPNERIYRFICRPKHGVSLCQCQDFQGLDGPADAGLVQIRDREMSLNFTKIQQVKEGVK